MAKASHYHYSHQGWSVHIIRRAVHLASLLILWLYNHYGAAVAHFFSLSLSQLIWLCLGVILGLEALRLYRGWVVFGQRHYEKKRISALAWGAIGMALVLLFAPGKQFAVPIISAYAIGDPLVGELRRSALPKWLVMIIGIWVISSIWWLSHLWLGTPPWWAILMGPLTVAAEWPCFTWIDDNALMQIIPLIAVVIISSLT